MWGFHALGPRFARYLTSGFRNWVSDNLVTKMLSYCSSDNFELNTTEGSPDLGELSLFGGLSPEQQRELLGYTQRISVTPGAKVFKQGDLPEALYIVLSGRVELIVERDGVATLEVSYHAGDTFGETAYIGIQVQPGTAMVAGEQAADLLVLDRDALLQMQNESLFLFAFLMMNIGREASRKYHQSLQ